MAPPVQKDPSSKKAWYAQVVGELGDRRIVKCEYCERETTTRKTGRIKCRGCNTILRLPGFVDARFK